MRNNRRIILATLFGFISGLFCFLGGRILGIEMGMEDFIMILFHRTILGFVIGISSLKWHWVLHGVLLGLIIGIPHPFFSQMLHGDSGSGIYFILGAVWGFLIEFFTSIVFKAKVICN